jgi:hypothetical protein
LSLQEKKLNSIHSKIIQDKLAEMQVRAGVSVSSTLQKAMINDRVAYLPIVDFFPQHFAQYFSCR